MPAPLSPDLRARIVETSKEGIDRVEIANRFRVGEATVSRLLAAWRRTGSIAPKTPSRKGRPPKIQGAALELLKSLVDERPDRSIAELHAMLVEAGVDTSTAAVSRALGRLGYTRKKRLSKL